MYSYVYVCIYIYINVNILYIYIFRGDMMINHQFLFGFPTFYTATVSSWPAIFQAAPGRAATSKWARPCQV